MDANEIGELRASLRGIEVSLSEIQRRLIDSGDALRELRGELKVVKVELTGRSDELEERLRKLEINHAEGRGRAAAVVGVASAGTAGAVTALLRLFGVAG